MNSTNHHTVNGRMIGETTDGVRTDYLTDALGSVTATVDQSQNVLNTYRYKPYGGLVAKTGASGDPRFLWTGDTGSRTTGLNCAEQYNRARHYGAQQAGWTSVDPLWPRQLAFNYLRGRPTVFADPTGLVGIYFQACAFIGGWRAHPWYRPYMSVDRDFLGWLGDLSQLINVPIPLPDVVPIGLSTNNRSFFQDPLSCKLFVQLSIDSCAVGSSGPTDNVKAGNSSIAVIFARQTWEIFNGPGRDVSSVQASRSPCASKATVSAQGFAGAPIIKHLPVPIQLDLRVTFTAGPDTVEVNWEVLRRTQFPDFEFRVGLAPSGRRGVWDVTSPYSGPGIGLLAPTVPGPKGNWIMRAPTDSCCGGSC